MVLFPSFSLWALVEEPNDKIGDNVIEKIGRRMCLSDPGAEVGGRRILGCIVYLSIYQFISYISCIKDFLYFHDFAAEFPPQDTLLQVYTSPVPVSLPSSGRAPTSLVSCRIVCPRLRAVTPAADHYLSVFSHL